MSLGNTVRLLLVVGDDRLRDLCCRELAAISAEVVVVSQLFPLTPLLEDQSFHGLLFDIKAKMREIRRHKTEVYQLTTRLPTAHLQLDGNTGKLRVFHPGQLAENSLLAFVENRCRFGQPQRIRNFPRKPLCLAVRIYLGETMQRPRQLVTKDISPGGCFLIAYQRIAVGRRVRLLFKDWEHLGPLLGEVRSVVSWGEGRELPGMGIRFLMLTSDQEQMLQRLCAER